MRRREFIAGLGSAAAWSCVAQAQQQPLPVIGLLSGFSTATALVANFHVGLKESGFVEGRNVRIEYRSADGEYDRLPELAAELIGKHVAVIAALGENAARAVKAARTSGRSKIPFVFSIGDDPVALVARVTRTEGTVSSA
jgi:putative tryptophan/tyrosine transport system substrate-binding protein